MSDSVRSQRACFGRGRSWWVVAWIVTSACSHNEPAPPRTAPVARSQPPAEQPAEGAAAIPTERERLARPTMLAMGDHFVTAIWARDCIVAGDLENARTAMQDLAAYEYPPDLSRRWGRELSELEAAARTAGHATTLEEGALGVANVARICGTCHAASGGGPATVVARPEHFSKYAEDSFTGRMYRHLWGAEQLWQGITAPSEPAWEAGAAAIRESPAAMERELPAKFGAALEKLRSLSTSAGAPQSVEQRTGLYAELLSTCATCHARAEAGALRGR